MRHLGDICKINGGEIEPVWCITGGSPCQDLSIAGKRAGLEGARSGLFMEQVRIVKEMRAEDKRNGRTGNMVRPRFLVWENVVGAFSSNRGKDFAVVLEEIARIAEPGFSLSGLPDKWKWTKAGAIDGDGWSIAWRTHDAKDWGKTIRDSRTGDIIRLGTPQRRRRISVVADFGGESAAQIQFDRESVSGHPAESGTAGERHAGTAEGGVNPTVARSLTARADGSPCVDRGPNIVCSPHQGGCDGGGKGALVQPELSGTLGTGNDQTIFCMATQQGGAELRIDDCAPTLTAAAGMSGNNQPVVATPINDKAARWRGGAIAFAANQREKVRDLGDRAGALAAEPGMHCRTFVAQPTYCLQGNGIDRADTAGCNGRGWREDVSYTLNTVDRPAVCAYGIGNGQLHEAESMVEEKAQTLNTMHDTQAVMCASFKAGQGAKAGSIGYAEEVSPTLAAAESGTNRTPCVLDMSHACDVIRECGDTVPTLQARMGTGGNQVPLVSHALRANGSDPCREDAATYPVQNMVVRRLTPLECERLQGFPDGWTDIGDWVDEKGKTHKSADSLRYKALGNSIALPFWQWLIDRMAAYLPEGATLGSLFDGISGFNVCWARIHGAERCQWSSEIERFPIAVAKKHFGDEDTGEEGDFEKFFRRDEKKNV